MSEEHPLLYEDFHEEDQIGSYYHRRVKPSSKGRAKYHMKGAAAIITKWPGLWTSLVVYWWIGLGMIALSIFIIYNCIFLFAMVPQARYIRPMPYKKYNITSPVKSLTNASNVYLHIFVNDGDNIDLHDYLPYIDILANDYKHFQFNIVIVTNDTTSNNGISDENNNKLALHKLWTDDLYTRKALRSNNTFIINTTLRNCFKDSPMEKFWDKVPKQFVKYLIRSASIWQNGGIAINPLILTPRSPDVAYIEKVQQILRSFNNSRDQSERKSKKENIKQNIVPKFNNILDIINAMERNEIENNSNEDALSAAESIDVIKFTPRQIISHLNRDDDVNHTNSKEDKYSEHITTNLIETNKNSAEKNDSSSDLLPLFLKYLFHNKVTHPDKEGFTSESLSDKITNNINDSEENRELNTLRTLTAGNNIVDTENYKPMIVSATEIFNHTDKETTKSDADSKSSLFKLTLDLKGNILATEVACHAFLGDMFMNSIYHSESESLTDFIIKELTIFCKGLLATCMGVDVILL